MKRWPLLLVCTTLPGFALAADDWGRLYASFSATTDYRYNGVSYSDSDPALQASVHWWRPDRFYAGVWTSSVDFNDPGHTSYELDAYAGRHFDAGDTRLSLEVLYTFFPDKTFRGPTYDFIQGKVRAQRAIGKLMLGGVAAWSPEASYDSGTMWRAHADTSYQVTRWLSLSADLGRRWIETGVDRTYWDAGVTLSWKRLSLDMRYADTNLSPAQCSDSDRCDATLIGTLTLRFYDL
jgi:uncharacterized protein (TIGR02001 family)